MDLIIWISTSNANKNVFSNLMRTIRNFQITLVLHLIHKLCPASKDNFGHTSFLLTNPNHEANMLCKTYKINSLIEKIKNSSPEISNKVTITKEMILWISKGINDFTLQLNRGVPLYNPFNSTQKLTEVNNCINTALRQAQLVVISLLHATWGWSSSSIL